ncbi:MAG: hypothetical protein GY742_16460 [Hyphomicrobiales bacterium]|nr:hypothetical protein [Hyphomicrobiales bacterium]
MIPSSSTSKPSAILIVFASLIAASMEIGAPQWLVLISGFCVAFYLLIEWKQLNVVSRITFFVCVALIAYLVISQKMSMAILISAFGRASFFAFFLVSLDVLRDAASSSPLIMRSGQKVIDQPPGRRYAVLTLSTHFFSILLNMGAINLLGTMTRRSIDAGYEKAGERVSQIRLRRMTLAMFRGFCSNTLWAPTSITVVVVMAAIPDYGWYEFFPVGVFLAILFLTVGWVLDRVSYPRSSLTYSGESFGQVLVALVPLLVLIVTVLGLTISISGIFGLRLIAALLFSVSLLGILWIYIQYRARNNGQAFKLFTQHISTGLLPSFCGLRSEIGIMCGSVFAGDLVLSQIDIALVSEIFASMGLGPKMLLLLMQWTVFAFSLVSLNPIVTVAISVEVLANLTGIEIENWLLAMTGITIWALVTGFSPFASANRISSRVIGRTAKEVGMIWNGRFTFGVMALLSVSILLLA